MQLSKQYEILPFYEDPVIMEVATYILLLLLAIVIVRLVRFFKRVNWLTDTDPLSFKNENRIVSPFLMKEQASGDISIQFGRKRIVSRILALFLIVIFVTMPLLEIMGDSNYINYFLWW